MIRRFTSRRAKRKGQTVDSSSDRSGRLRFEALEDRRLLTVTTPNIPSWNDAGPGPIEQGQVEGMTSQRNPVSGAINAIAAHPTNADVVYIGAVNGGVWRTNNARWPIDGLDNDNDGLIDSLDLNGGEDVSWATFTDQYPSLSIGALAFSPIDPVTLAPTDQALFAGIGSFSSSGSGGLANGILRTRDGGGTWELLGSQTFDGLPVTSVIPTSLSTPTGQVVFASTIETTVPDRGGVFRSRDGGVTWTQISNNTLVAGSVSDLALDPGNSQRLYAALPGNGVYRTIDAGDHWVPVNNGLANFTATSRIELAVSPAGNRSVYAALIGNTTDCLGSGEGLIGLYRSNNRADSWTPMSLPTTNDLLHVGDMNGDGDNGDAGETRAVVCGLHPSGQGDLHFSIAAHPTDDQAVFIGAAAQPTAGWQWRDADGDRMMQQAEIIRTASGSGTSNVSGRLFRGDASSQPPASQWQHVVGSGAGGTSPHADSRDLVFDRAGNLLEADDGGIYVLQNADATGPTRRWASLNGNVHVSELYRVAYDTTSRRLIAGAQDVGVPAQSAGSPNWIDIYQGDGDVVYIDNTGAAPVYYFSQPNLSGFYRVTVDGIDNSAPPNGVADLNDFSEWSPINLVIVGANGRALSPVFDSSVDFTHTYAINSVRPFRMLIGTDYLYESFDFGATLNSLGGISPLNTNHVDDDGDGIADPVGAGGCLDADGDGVPDQGVDANADGALDLCDIDDGFIPRKPVGPVTALAYGGQGDGADAPDIAYVAVHGPFQPVRLLLRKQRSGSGTVDDFKPTAYRGDEIRDIVLDPDDWRRAYVVTPQSVHRTLDAGATWQELTGLDHVSSPQIPRNFRTIEFVKVPGAGTMPAASVLLVGGLAGVFRAVLPTSPSVTDLRWTEYGEDLANAPVTDLHYYDGTTDTLVVATRGRGAWTVSNVSRTIAQPGILVIEGDAGTNNITLARNAGNPLLIDVLEGGQNRGSFQLSTLERIDVRTLGGNDSLTIDLRNGLIPVPDGIDYDGGADSDTLIYVGTTAVAEDNRGPGGAEQSGQSVLSRDNEVQAVYFRYLEGPPQSAPLTHDSSPAVIRSGLQSSTRGVKPTGLKKPLPATGAIDRALHGTMFAEPRPIRDRTIGVPEADEEEEQEDGASGLIERLIETGLGAFSLSDIGMSIATLEDLRSRLDSLDMIPGNVTYDETGGVTRFDVRIEKTLKGMSDLDVSVLDGRLSLEGTLELSADIAFHLVFGVDARGFFIDVAGNPDPEIVVSNLRIGGDLSGEGRFGFLGVALSEASLALGPDVRLTIDLVEPGADPYTGLEDGLVRLFELGPEFNDAAMVTLIGDPVADDVIFAGNFTVSAVVPRFAAPFDLGDAEVTLRWPDINDLDSIEITAETAAGQALVEMLDISAQDVLDGLKQLRSGMDRVRDTALADAKIPFTNGTTLGEVLDVATVLDDQVIRFLEDPNGKPTFATAQELVSQFASAIGLDYDPATKELSYTLSLSHQFDPIEATIGFAQGLGSVGEVASSSRVTLTPELTFDTTFGFDLSGLLSGTWADHFFLKDTSLTGQVALAASDLDATAHFGFFGVEVADGSADANVSIELSLTDPGTVAQDGKISLTEFWSGLSSVSSLVGAPGISGSAHVTLPVRLNPNFLGADHPADPRITVDWPDITDTDTLTLNFNDDMQELASFEHLSLLDVINALLSAGQYLASLEEFSFLNEKLPLVNRSVSDLLDYAQEFTETVQSVQNDPAGTLQELERQLKVALGLVPDSPLVNLALDGTALRIELAAGADFNESIPIDLDLAALAEAAGGIPELEGVSRLVDLSGSVVLSLAASAAANIHLGIDLADPLSPHPFLYDTTQFVVDARATGTNLNFDAPLGPLGVYIRNGTAVMDGDGVIGTTAPVRFTVGLVDPDGDGRLDFDELAQLDPAMVDVDLAGQVRATLPVYFPTSTNLLGDIDLRITSLADIPGTIQLTAPDISSQFGLIDLLNNVGVLVVGLDGVLARVQDALDAEVFAARLPLIGRELQKAAQFIERLREEAVQPLADALSDTPPVDAVRQGLFDVLGPSGLNLLDKDFHDAGSDNVPDTAADINDIEVETTPDGNQIQFNLRLKRAMAIVDTPIAFDLGVPVLGLEVDGNVNVRLGFELLLGFGVNVEQGFYFDTSPQNELRVELEATIPGLTAEGHLGFLQIDIQDDAASPSVLAGAFTIDLVDPIDDPFDPDDDDQLTFLDLASVEEFSDVIDAQFTAAADINLKLATSFNADARFPSISADFHFDWVFDRANPAGNPAAFGDRPHVVFDHIQLHLGEFFSRFAGPILDQIQDLIEPIQPLIEFLTDPLPVISEILNDDVSILDIIAVLPPINGIDITADQVEFFEAAARLIGLIGKIPNNVGDVMIDLGSFEIGGEGGTGDLRRILGTVSEEDLDHVNEMDTDAQLHQDDVGDFFDEAEDIEGGVDFPILKDPGQVFNLLLGGDATLFKYQLPELRAELTFEKKYQPFPPAPLFVNFRGVLGATANLGFGYDTTGLRRYQESKDWRDVFSGFFIDDHATYDNRGKPIEDKPEATLYGSVTAGASIGVGIEGGVEGGLFGTVLIDLMDPIADGAVHFDELVASLEEGLLCTFNVSGDVRARVVAYIEVAGERTHEEKLGESGPLLSFDLGPDQCFSSRFEPNNVIDTAADIGVAPGIHLVDLSLVPQGDTDWYRFDVLRPDSVSIVAEGDVKLEVTQADGSLLGRGSDEGDKTKLTLQNLAAGTYYVHVYGSSLGNYDLSIDAISGTALGGLHGTQSPPTRVFYVNDPTVNDPAVASFYSLEPGDDANDGMSPTTPKATVQSVLTSYDLGPGDLVLIDTGMYASGAVTLAAADSGTMFAGTPEGSRFAAGSRWRLVGADDVVLDGLTFDAVTGTAIEVDYTRTVPADDANNNILRRNVFRNIGTAIRIDGGAGNVVESNQIDTPTTAGIDAVLTTGLVVRGNEISDAPTGIRLDRGQTDIDSNSIVGSTVAAIHLIEASAAAVSDNPIDESAIGILVSGGGSIAIDDNVIVGSATGIQVLNATSLAVSGNVLDDVQTGVRFQDLQGGSLVNNVITATGASGIWLRAGGTVTVRGNVVEGSSEGIAISTSTGDFLDLNARNNLISGASIGLRLADAGIGGRLTGNEFYNNDTGLLITASGVEVDGNQLHDNQTGLRLSGSAAIVHDNQLYENSVGLHQTGGSSSVYGNSIYNNTLGVRSNGLFGPTSWSASHPNDIYQNVTGVEASTGANVQFNRLHHNSAGVRIVGAARVHHNLIYRNTGHGAIISSTAGAIVESNTVYTPAGNAIQLDGPTTNLTLKSNILWTENGYALASPTDDHAGLTSDFNNLYVSGAGKLILWKKEIADLLDWQVETDSDLHSIGYTTIGPLRDNPRFIDVASDDYHLTDAVSTSIDAGDRLAAFDQEPAPNGGRIDLGAYGNTAEAAVSASGVRLDVDYPNFYTDWPASEGRFIRWAAYGVTGNVDIDLYEEGIGKIGDVAIISADAGSYLWSPGDNNVVGNAGRRYRLRIASINNPAVFVVSREAFAVPPETSVFYVNDAATIQDAYTSAVGGNRNTGRTAADPKPSLLAVMKAYDLDAGDTLYVDAGEYRHLGDAIFSGDLAIGNDEGMTVTGPLDPARVARIVQFSDRPSQAAIDINNADFVTISHLTLIGGPTGLWVRNGSTDFRGEHLTTSGHPLDGLRIDTGSATASLDWIVATDNGRYGIGAEGPLGQLTNSTVYGNRNTGVLLSSPTSALVADNVIRDNRGDGLVIHSAQGARVEHNQMFGNLRGGLTVSASGPSLTVVGHDDLSLSRGNIVHDNGEHGIYASGPVRVVGNTSFGHSANNQIGIYGADQIVSNVVFGNDFGIYSTGSISNNRVYQNRGTGIITGASGRVVGNVVYSNGTGIQVGCCGLYNSAELVNNIIYANSTVGIRAYPGDTVKVVNNIVHQPGGNALLFEGDATRFQIRNNIFSVAAGYAINAGSFNLRELASNYNDFYVTGTGQVGQWQGVGRATLARWRSAAFTDGSSLAQDPLFLDFDGPDNVLGYSSSGSDGRDDDFHLKSLYGSFHGGSLAPVLNATTNLPLMLQAVETIDAQQSPLIDRGAASDPIAAEPLPNGGFINIGAYGNTSQASKSPASYLLVLSPNGGESWPVEQSFPIRWRSNDPLEGYALAFDGADDYVAVTEPTDGSLDLGASATLEAWVKFNSLPNGSLATILSKDEGGGGRNKWIFGYARNYANIANGTFLHINSPTAGSVFLGSNPWTPELGRWYHLAIVRSGDQYSFYRDGVLDGTSSTTVNIPPVAYPIEIGRAEGNFYFSGVIDDVHIWNTSRQAAEIQAMMTVGVTGTESGLVAAWDFEQAGTATALDRTPHAHDGTLGGGVASRLPTWVARTQAVTVDIELLQSGNATAVLTIADDTPNDGEFSWLLPTSLPPATNFLIRATRTDNGVTDTTDVPFSVTPPIHNYYVNDATVQPGDWTTAPGDDANDGLAPERPKASVRALLETYDLEPGDIVLVDAGTYALSTTLTITAADSGVRIEGYHDERFADRRAILDRGVAAGGNQVIELVNADDVTLDHLSLTGGFYAIYAASGSDSDRLTLSNNDIYGYVGVQLETTNDGAVIVNNYVHDLANGANYVFVQGNDATVVGNRIGRTVPSGGTGLSLHGQRITAQGNEVWNLYYGIQVGGGNAGLANRNVVTGNQVHDNGSRGITASTDALVTGNDVYGHSTGYGIESYGTAIVESNDVYDNAIGMVVTATARNNRVYHNSQVGIVTGASGVVTGNTVYSNPLGIQVGCCGLYNAAQVTNNLVYTNTTAGIQFYGPNGVLVANNTVYQSMGDALVFETDTPRITVKNNILVSSGGYVINGGGFNLLGFASDYNLLDATNTAKLARWQGRDFTSRVEWSYELGLDAHSQTVNPQFVDVDGPDDLLGYVAGVDYGLDDNFSLLAGSPGIDAGDPADPFVLESSPNGARINVGHQGNTPQATNSPLQTVQLLSPNGLEKFEQGQPVVIQWRSSGLAADPPYADVVRTDDPAGYWRLNETSGTSAGDTSMHALAGTYQNGVVLGTPGPLPEGPNLAATFDGTDDFVEVPHAAPLDPRREITLELWFNAASLDTSWRSMVYKGTGAVPGRTYSLWLNSAGYLHFTSADATGQEYLETLPGSIRTDQWYHFAGVIDRNLGQMKAYLNGQLVASGPVRTNNTVSHSQPLRIGSSLEGYPPFRGAMAEVAVYDHILTDDQIQRHARPAFGTAQIELLQDQTVVLVIGNDVPNNGSLLWTVPASLADGAEYQVRVHANTALAPEDTSDAPFLVANSGVHYYINDASTTGDVFTTALGDNANSGKSPYSPMSSLPALLAAYDLDPGDVIHVDAGTYNLIKNVTITNQDSGVRIEGPSTAAAILDRGAPVGSNQVIELVNADDVTLDHLSLTGGQYAVYAASDSDSDRLTLSSNDIYGYGWGVWIEDTNDQAVIVNNHVHDLASGAYYVFVRGSDATIAGNQIGRTGAAGDGIGMSLWGERNTAQGNEVWNLNYGINNAGGGSGAVNRNVIVGNLIHDNLYVGIQNGGNAQVTGNTVYGQRDSGDMGIHSFGIGLFENNEVYDNAIGILAYGGLTRNNRVYHNSQVGIVATQSAMVQGNTVYSNPLGIQAGCCGVFNAAQVTNNLVYANTTAGILVGRTYNANGVLVAKNTVYQAAGDALVFEGDTTLVTVKNNILATGGGYVINGGGYNLLGLASDHNLLYATGTAKLARWQGRDFTSRVDWFYELGLDAHSQAADPRFVDFDGPDNQLGYVAGVDHGLDDNFGLLATSPGVDAGDPADPFALETSPNGGRINVGHHGNTTLATNSPLQIVQVLAPNGLEKLEAGQNVTIQWRSAGIALDPPYVTVVQAENPAGYWPLSETSGTTASDASTSALAGTYRNGVVLGAPGPVNMAATFDGVDDFVEVPHAAQLDPRREITVELWFNAAAFDTQWRSMIYKGTGAVSGRTYSLWLNSAGYLHFTSADSSGQEYVETLPGSIRAGQWYHFAGVIDRNRGQLKIYLNGQLAASGAVRTTSTVSHTQPLRIGGNLEGNPPFKGALAEVAIYDHVLTDERIGAHGKPAFGTARIELVRAADNAVELVIADETPNDGELLWTVPASLAVEHQEYRIRVRANTPLSPQDTSDASFLVSNGGTHYYVNDASVTGDEFTTALGDNANSGKSPAAPMSSLPALLSAYDLDPGDVIHVDAGTYDLIKNVTITSQDSGLRIEGPASVAAVLNRANQAGGNYVFELFNADDVTLDHLSLTGGYYPVFASNASDSDRLTLSNLEIYGNVGGVHLDVSNDEAVILGNHAHDQTHFGTPMFYVGGRQATISGNRVDRGFSDQRGIQVSGRGTLISGNEISGMNHGILAGTGDEPGDPIVIRDNISHDNTYQGISASGNVLVTGNRVYGHRAANAVGITVGGATTLVEDNEVYDNATGIVAYGGLTRDNRVYHNSQVGILTGQSAVVMGNTVYSNPLGIQVGCCGTYNAAQVTNNLVYANTEYGIVVGRTYDANGVALVNNTIYQSVGDAIRIETGSSNMVIKNNILSIGAGYGLNFLSSNHANAASDYNLFHRLTETQANIAFWNGSARSTLAAWQAAAGQDAHSVAAAAGFVDINGADDVLAFAAGNTYDGGRDDNFNLAGGSAAIDSGDATIAPTTDRAGFGRADDPATPNLGTPPGSFVDMGAFEFQGTSSDTQPPTILSTTPAAIDAGARVSALSEIILTTSEPLILIDAQALANYELRSSGPNNLFGDGDDSLYTALPTYQAGSTQIALRWAGSGLPDGNYRLIVSPTGGLRDTAGLALDGDANGTPGGAYVRLFSVGAAVGDFDRDGNVNQRDIDQLYAAIAAGSTNLAFDLSGNGVVDVADVNVLVRDVLGTHFGDANLDGRVDRTDLAVLASRLGQTGAPGWAGGDFNGDGVVGLSDLVRLQQNFGFPAVSSIVGDFDRDGTLDAGDIDALMAEMAKPAPNASFDLTGDGRVDAADVRYLVENLMHTRFGDANLDGSVNRADAAIVALSFGRGETLGWAGGDFDGDGRVTVRDAELVQRNMPTAGPSAPAATVVAEHSLRGVARLQGRRRMSVVERPPSAGGPPAASDEPVAMRLLATRSDRRAAKRN